MFLFQAHEARSRSIVKAFSWRALGSIDTFVLSWLFTGNAKAAGAIASTEVLTKMILYYFHERAWSTIHWGFREVPVEPEETDKEDVRAHPTIAEIIEEGGQ